ncbi:DUF1822 family protein [Fischerella thermalis]|uniref:DUF1822 family protein n=1 Tax=Fischerella thermalis TaxID=372787 RepID=UPI000C7FA460|nr:DUF1822 family protein [Fischerella thermalis]PLZ68702.1 hypothetical protein CBP22_10540 [Fischerella thermalis WC249]
MNYLTEHQTISIPIPEEFRENALKFAREQPTPTRGRQVYLNTLAVQVVNTYLQMLDIPTDLESSYIWQPYRRLIDDVADLVLTGVGHLECRAIRTGDRICYIPPEVWHDRIGYVVVEINQTCKEGKIWGFLPNVTTSEIDINQLHSLDELIERSHLISLRAWLENMYTTEWQTVEEFTRKRKPQFAFRSIKRVRGLKLESPDIVWQIIEQFYPNHSWQKGLPSKFMPKKFNNRCEELEVNNNSNISSELLDILVHLIRTTEDEETRWTLAEILWTLQPNHPAVTARRVMDLGMQLDGSAVALMVAVLPKPDQTVAVLLRVYPMNNAYLPLGLQLAGLYEDGQAFLEVQARGDDDYIQLKFCAEFGEKFRVRVGLNDAVIIENFVI